MSKFEKTVITGQQTQAVFSDAKANLYALPAVNVANTTTVNAVI